MVLIDLNHAVLIGVSILIVMEESDWTEQVSGHWLKGQTRRTLYKS